MTTILIICLVVLAIAISAKFFYDGIQSKARNAAKQLVDKELSKILDKEKEKIEHVVDPSVPIGINEAVNELRKTRDNGRTN